MMIKELITSNYEDMSKTHKKIASYVLKNTTAVSYFNIGQLAEAVGTSEASILRFCTHLGFKGFPEFKNQLQSEAQNQMSLADRLAISQKAYDEKELGIAEIFQHDAGRIAKTLEKLDMDDFFAACQKIILAKKIYILSARSAISLGQFFQYYLNMTLGNVELINSLDCRADLLCDISSDDVVIAITFSRYSKVTGEMFKYASEKGAVSIAITDSEVSPIVKPATYAFLAETSMPSYIDSFVAPLTLINAFLVEIGRNRNIELTNRINKLDEFSKTFDIFE